MEPEQLQLGFLKVLKGSYMEEMKQKYGLLSQSKPPYEVLRTNWLSYEEVIRLKGVEEMVEVYYNSGQFRRTMKCLSQEWGDAFDLYDRLAAFYEEEGLNGVSHNRLARYEILYLFIQKLGETKKFSYQDLLIYDLYLRENVKSRPSFAPDPSEWKKETKQFFMREAKERRYLRATRHTIPGRWRNGAFRADGRRKHLCCLITKTGMLCLAMRRHFHFPGLKYSEKWEFF